MAERLTREERRQQTREALLGAAGRVFARHGFHDASVERVAEEAGYTKGAVYSNFASKEELFLALLDRRTQEQLPQIARLFAIDAEEELRDALARDFAHVPAEHQAWTLLSVEFWLYAMRDPTARAQLAERYSELRERFGELIAERMAAEGETVVLPPTQLATLVIAMDTGLFVQGVIDPAAVPPDLTARAMIRLLSGSW
jgi:AcrR family transcriptional regulator